MALQFDRYYMVSLQDGEHPSQRIEVPCILTNSCGPILTVIITGPHGFPQPVKTDDDWLYLGPHETYSDLLLAKGRRDNPE